MHRLPILMLLLSAGCRHPADVTPAPAWNQTEVAVMVVNHNWSDIRVYLLHDGVSQRIGLVVAASSATFSVPGRNFASGASVQLRATLIGNSAVVTTPPLLLQPDQVITWTIEGYLPSSSVFVQ